jgi:AraC family transcriptional regulator of adaptative response / DNA-3-methyladenine glycosylase II
VPGVEEWRDGAFRRTVLLPGGPAVLAVAPAAGHIRGEVTFLDDDAGPDGGGRRAADLAAAGRLAARLLDLGTDPGPIDAVLGRDPLLADLVAAAPGRRVPGTVDGDEMAVRAVLGQQVSTAAARTHAARLVSAHGRPLPRPVGSLTHLFPTAAALTALDPAALRLPAARRATLRRLVDALASGEIDLTVGADPALARSRLAALPGIGPWTLGTVAMRALGDPDAFLPGDLGVRAAAGALGLPTTARRLEARAEAWRPWRAYAVQHLWGTGGHAVNRMPVG